MNKAVNPNSDCTSLFSCLQYTFSFSTDTNSNNFLFVCLFFVCFSLEVRDGEGGGRRNKFQTIPELVRIAGTLHRFEQNCLSKLGLYLAVYLFTIHIFFFYTQTQTQTIFFLSLSLKVRDGRGGERRNKFQTMAGLVRIFFSSQCGKMRILHKNVCRHTAYGS